MGVLHIERTILRDTAFSWYGVKRKTEDEAHAHSHSYQISIPLTKSAKVQCDRGVRAVPPLQYVMMNPESRHQHFAGEDDQAFLLVFLQTKFLEEVLFQLTEGNVESIEFSIWGEGSSRSLVQMAEKARRMQERGKPSLIEVEELEWQLARYVLRSFQGTHRKKWLTPNMGMEIEHPSIRRMMEYVQEVYTGEISLEDMSSIAGMNKYHLLRVFRAQTGMTPSQYVNSVRLQQAERLLSSGKGDVTSIAFDSGFGSLSTFERQFKKKHGVTPDQYRKGKREEG